MTTITLGRGGCGVVRLRHGGERRLICLPFAAGSAHMYGALAQSLPGWDVTALELPGHGAQPGNLLTDYREAVRILSTAVAEVARPPYVLFGHSMGALLAAGVTDRLERACLTPAAVVLSAGHPVESHHVATDQRSLVELLRRHGGTPEELLTNDEFLDYLLPVLRADLAIVGSFRANGRSQRRPPALFVAGSEDDEASPAAMAGWGRYFDDHRSITLPGGHMSVITDPRPLAQAITRFADRFSPR